jgi:outer membrane protein OmpA-like peptidoglycan-associated protein
MDLSKRRAGYVKQLLEQKGLTLPVTVHGEGEHDPIRVGKSEQDYAFNRRVEFRIE